MLKLVLLPQKPTKIDKVIKILLDLTATLATPFSTCPGVVSSNPTFDNTLYGMYGCIFLMQELYIFLNVKNKSVHQGLVIIKNKIHIRIIKYTYYLLEDGPIIYQVTFK